MLLNQFLPVISFNIITKASMSMVWFLFLCCEVTCWVQRATKALHQLMPHEGEKRSESYMDALLRGGFQETHACNTKINKQTKTNKIIATYLVMVSWCFGFVDAVYLIIIKIEHLFTS